MNESRTSSNSVRNTKSLYKLNSLADSFPFFLFGRIDDLAFSASCPAIPSFAKFGLNVRLSYSPGLLTLGVS